MKHEPTECSGCEASSRMRKLELRDNPTACREGQSGWQPSNTERRKRSTARTTRRTTKRRDWLSLSASADHASLQRRNSATAQRQENNSAPPSSRIRVRMRRHWGGKWSSKLNNAKATSFENLIIHQRGSWRRGNSSFDGEKVRAWKVFGGTECVCYRDPSTNEFWGRWKEGILFSRAVRLN